MRFVALALALASAAACGGTDFVAGNGDGGGGPPPPGDASMVDGNAGCTGTPPLCTGICGGPPPPASCVGGAWVCPIISGICLSDASFPVDATAHETGGSPDAQPPLDAPPPDDGGLACGPQTCNEGTQYCQVDNYPNHLDGGVTITYMCQPIPLACQVNPSCACIQTQAGCTCAPTGGGFTVTCDFP
jgi:hypothetical protein